MNGWHANCQANLVTPLFWITSEPNRLSESYKSPATNTFSNHTAPKINGLAWIFLVGLSYFFRHRFPSSHVLDHLDLNSLGSDLPAFGVQGKQGAHLAHQHLTVDERSTEMNRNDILPRKLKWTWKSPLGKGEPSTNHQFSGSMDSGAVSCWRIVGKTFRRLPSLKLTVCT